MNRPLRTATPPAILAATAMVAAVAIVAAMATPVAAHPESAAPEMHPDVVAVGHSPDTPQPDTQWSGFIRFAPGHDVGMVQYQICEVGNVCFAAPTAAQRNGDTFSFNTTDYGHPPVRWGMGNGSAWNVGYKFVLHHADGNLSKFPHGLSPGSDECKGLGHFACDATNYFVFTIPGAVDDRGVPGPLLVAPLMLALAWMRRMGHGREEALA